MKVATGTYSGDGIDNKQITGLGFQPSLVIVQANVSRAAAFKVAEMPAGKSWQMTGSPASEQSDGIKSLDADGFTLGTNTTVNESGTTYWWVVVTDNGDGDFITGTYTGNSSSPRDITGLGFTPVFVSIAGYPGQQGVWRTDEAGANWCARWANFAMLQNTGLNAFVADGFTIGSSLNSSGNVAYYFAFSGALGNFHHSSYTGNGVDGKDITGVPFQPDGIFVKRTNVSTATRLRTSNMAADQAVGVGNAGSATDYVQGILSNGFTVGFQLNINLAPYVFVCIKSGSSAVTAKVGSDSGTATETANPPAISSVGESGTGSEASTLQATQTGTVESGTGTESAAVAEAFAGSDDGAAAESSDLVQTFVDMDDGVATESGSLEADLAASEAPIGTESAVLAPGVGTDDGTGSETSDVRDVKAGADDGLVSESAVLEVTLAASESGLGGENAILVSTVYKSDTDDGLATESAILAVSGVEDGTGTEGSILSLAGVDSGTGADTAERVDILTKHISRCTIESTLAALADSIDLTLVETGSLGLLSPLVQSWLTLTEGDLIRVKLGLVGIGFDEYGVFRVDQTDLAASPSSWSTNIQGRDKAALLIEEKGRASGSFAYGSYPDINQEALVRPTCKAIGLRIASESGLGLIWDAPNYPLKSFAIGKDEAMSSVLSRLLSPLQQSQRYRTDAWVDGDNLVIRRRGNSPVLGTVDCDLGLVTRISRRRQPLVGTIDVYGGTETIKGSYTENEQNQDTKDRKDEKTSEVEVEDDGQGHRIVRTFLLEADELTWVQVQEEVEDQDFEEVFDGDKWIGRVLEETRTTITTDMNTATPKTEKRTIILGYDDIWRLATRHELAEEYNTTTFEFDKTAQTHTRFEQITPTDVRTTTTEWKVVASELKVKKGFPKRIEQPGQLQSSLRVSQDARSAWDEEEDGSQPPKTKTTESTIQYHGSATGGGTLPKAISDGNLMGNSACQEIADDLAAESGAWLYSIELRWSRPFAYHKGDRVTLTNLPGGMASAVALITSVRTNFDRQASEWTHDVSFEIWAAV